MEGSITDEQAHLWLQEIIDGARTVVNGVTTLSGSWVSLHYDNPALHGEDRAELAGGGYTRVAMIWDPPSNRGIWSTIDARFTGLMANKITYCGVWDQKIKGVLRAYAELLEPAVVLNGGGYVLHEKLLAITFG